MSFPQGIAAHCLPVCMHIQVIETQTAHHACHVERSSMENDLGLYPLGKEASGKGKCEASMQLSTPPPFRSSISFNKVPVARSP